MFGVKVNTAAISHAASEYPKESCGMVVRGTYTPCVNTHSEPELHFKIATKVFLKYKKVQGIIHSHPMGPKNPSEDDLIGQLSSNIPWGVVAKGRVVWYGDSVPKAPLIGREFIYGVHDCSTLVRDWFLLVYSLKLDVFPTSYGWWDTETNSGAKFIEGLGTKGFNVVTDDTIKIGDIWVGSFGKNYLSHVGVICGPNMILHHLVDHASCMSPINTWDKYFTYRLRLENLNG